MISEDYEVSMPVYDGIIKDHEIVAVLSYIKSTWPADITEIHNKINSDYKSNRAMKEKMGGSQLTNKQGQKYIPCRTMKIKNKFRNQSR